MIDRRRTLRTAFIGALVLFLVAGTGVLVGTANQNTDAAPSTAASDGSISADPNDAGATATHTATATVGADAGGSSLNSVVVDYGDSGADISNVDQDDVVVIGIDRGDDQNGTAIDRDVSDDVDSVSASNDGQTLRIGLGGSYDLEEGDEVVVRFEDAQNPDEPGEYTVSLTVNEQSAAATTNATLAIEKQQDDSDCPTDDE